MYYFRNDLKNKKKVEINVPHKKMMMCLNESFFNPFEAVGDQVIERLKHVPLNRYFNNITSELKTKLAEYAGVKEDQLLYGNGADDMLYFLFTSVRESSDSYAVTLAPSYFDYTSYCNAVGLGIKYIDVNKNFDFDVDKYLEIASSDDCKLCILCNPNNPTGNLLSDDKIIKVIENSNRLVLIDETYFEFSGKTFRDKLTEYPNLILLRSFSKSFSAAGLRFGYALSNPAIIRELDKVIPAFHMNLMTQAFVVSILDNKELFLNHNANVIRYRQEMYEELSRLPQVKVHNSHTNFLTFYLNEKSADLHQFLSDNEIAIRNVGAHPVMKNHLRVSISEPAHNRIFLDKVKEFIDINF